MLHFFGKLAANAHVVKRQRHGANPCIVSLHQLLIFLRLAPVQPDNGVQILELPLAPLVQCAVHHSIVIPGVEEQHLVLQLFGLSLIKEPQGTGQALGVEEVIAHADHHIHMTGLHQLLTNVAVLAGAVRGGGSHDKARPAVFVQVGVEIGDPEIVGVAEFLFCVDGRQTKGQTACALSRFGVDLVHIEGRIGHHIVAAAVQIVGIVVEGVGFVAGLDDAIESVNGHIHQAELGVIVHFLLTVEGHSRVGLHTGFIHKITGLDEHAAAAAGRVQQDTAGRLQHIDDHFDQRFGREEHAIVLGDVLCELIEKILVDAADDIAAHFVQSAVVEDAKKFCQQFIREHGVVLGQHAGELLRLGLHQFHGVVDHLAQTVHGVAALIFQPGGSNISREIDQVFILGFPWQKQGALGGEVAGLHRHHAPVADGTVLQYLGFDLLKAAIRITQENQTQHGHTILIRGQL